MPRRPGGPGRKHASREQALLAVKKLLDMQNAQPPIEEENKDPHDVSTFNDDDTQGGGQKEKDDTQGGGQKEKDDTQGGGQGRKKTSSSLYTSDEEEEEQDSNNEEDDQQPPGGAPAATTSSSSTSNPRKRERKQDQPSRSTAALFAMNTWNMRPVPKKTRKNVTKMNSVLFFS
uniref:Uncharacterized protein n=1 Tax=Panagrolaimus superbus TaxID=310955 RepID=A0A914YGR6_9BILA